MKEKDRERKKGERKKGDWNRQTEEREEDKKSEREVDELDCPTAGQWHNVGQVNSTLALPI